MSIIQPPDPAVTHATTFPGFTVEIVSIYNVSAIVDTRCEQCHYLNRIN